MIGIRGNFLLFALFSLPLAGCSAPQQLPTLSNEQVRQRWLSPIADGRTTRTDVQKLLGEPAFRFSNDRIFAYRLILAHRSTEPSNEEYLNESNWRGKFEENNNRRKQIADNGALLSIRDVNEESVRKLILLREAEFGLLLVFDDSGVLSQHSFSRINRE
jgi:hypothetical protein